MARRRSLLFLPLGLFMAFCVGCVTVSPPVTQRRQIGEQRTAFRDNRQGNHELSGASWDGDTLHATVRLPHLCYSAMRIDRKMQTYEERHVVSKGTLAFYYVFGILGMAGGGTLLGLSPAFSTEPEYSDDGEELLSDRASVLMGGGALAGLGLGTLIYALVQSGKAVDHKVGDPKIDTEVERTGPIENCGFDQLPGGEMFAGLADRPDVRVAVPAGQAELVFDLKSHANELCGNEADLGKPLNVWLVPSGGGERLELGTRNVDDCIRMTVSSRILTDVESRIDAATDVAVLSGVGASVRHAADLTAAMAPDNPGRQALQERLDQVRRRTRDKASGLLDQVLKSLGGSRGDDDYQQTAAGAFSLVQMVPERNGEVWKTVYSGWIQRCMNSGYPGCATLVVVIKQDPLVSACLANGSSCPDWLRNSGLIADFKPPFDKMAELTGTAADGTRKMAAAYRKTVSEANRGKLIDVAVPIGRMKLAWCTDVSEWDDGVRSSCENATKSVAAAQAVINEMAPKLERILVSKTEKAWRGYFSRCRTVRNGWDKLNSLGRCDDLCRRARDRMQKDWDSLQRFEVPGAHYSDQGLPVLRKECHEAGCPRCP